MHYSYAQKVLFRHCDPAGIVFYPRFFEMMNDAVEAMFAEKLGWPFEAMHPDGGVPTAEITTRFRAPCRQGDRLELQLTITRVGRTSLGLATRGVGAGKGDLRFEADQTLVCIGADGRPAPWPDPVRHELTEMTETQR